MYPCPNREIHWNNKWTYGNSGTSTYEKRELNYNLKTVAFEGGPRFITSTIFYLMYPADLPQPETAVRYKVNERTLKQHVKILN